MVRDCRKQGRLAARFRHCAAAAARCPRSLVTAAGAAAADVSTWRIASVNGLAAEGETEMRFSDDGGISGSAGCNRFTGTVRLADGALLVEAPLATTRMACPDATLSGQEDAVLRLLAERVAFDYDPASGVMTLTRGSDQMTLIPTASGEYPASQGASRLLEAGFVDVYGLEGPLNIRREANTASPVVTRVLAGTLLRNGGCESREDRDWCRIAFIDASGLSGWAAAEYLQPAPALVRAKDGVFDRIGRLSCLIPAESPVQDCDFGLARDGTHSAALVIYPPDGGALLLSFADGQFISGFEDGKPIAGAESVLGDGTISVTLPQARYDIPESLLTGTAE